MLNLLHKTRQKRLC